MLFAKPSQTLQINIYIQQSLQFHNLGQCWREESISTEVLVLFILIIEATI